MARKMEELTFEAVNKIFAKDDSGAYDCLRFVRKQILRLIYLETKSLEGQYMALNSVTVCK